MICLIINIMLNSIAKIKGDALSFNLLIFIASS